MHTLLYRSLLNTISYISPSFNVTKILTFHGISDSRTNRNELSAEVFENIIEYLIERRYEFYKVSDYPKIIENENAVCLTFDDGSYSNYIIAKDYLKRKNIPATFFIPTIIFDEKRRERIAHNYENGCMNESHVKELYNLGFEIGGHSHSHRLLSKLDNNELSQDIRMCKSILENIIGSPVTSFAYPYGLKNSYSKLTRELIVENEFKFICTQNNTLNDKRKNDYFEIPRIGIDGRDSFNIVLKKMKGKCVLLNNLLNRKNVYNA